jgi:hypothetical protein
VSLSLPTPPVRCCAKWLTQCYTLAIARCALASIAHRDHELHENDGKVDPGPRYEYRDRRKCPSPPPPPPLAHRADAERALQQASSVSKPKSERRDARERRRDEEARPLWGSEERADAPKRTREHGQHASACVIVLLVISY